MTNPLDREIYGVIAELRLALRLLSNHHHLTRETHMTVVDILNAAKIELEAMPGQIDAALAAAATADSPAALAAAQDVQVATQAVADKLTAILAPPAPAPAPANEPTPEPTADPAA